MTIFTELENIYCGSVSQEGLDDNIHRTSFKTFTVVHKKISQEGLDDNIQN